MLILDAARRAEKELGAEIVIVKKTSTEYAALQEKPPCPSVKVNDRFISKGELVTFDQIKKAILTEQERGG